MRTNQTFLTAGILLAALSNSFSQSTLQFTTNLYAVAENAGLAFLSVQRTGDTNTEVSVDYATADGTATNGLKYTATNGTLNFAPGETNQTIAVSILNNGFVEVTRNFKVILSNPTNAVLGTRTNPTVYITDNDKGLALEFANYWAREDEGSVLIGVARGDDGKLPMSVDFATSNLTATNGLDYTPTNGTLSFAAGEKVRLFTIPILNDGLKESSKTLRVTLSNPTNQVLSSPITATITVLDNDPGVQFTKNQLWVHEKEGTILLTVSRGNDGLLGAFTVDYATTNLTAIAGQDYVETHGTLEFAVGEMAKSLIVPVVNDGVAEGDEQFQVLLGNPSSGMPLGPVTNTTAIVTICDVSEMQPHRLDLVQVSSDGSVALSLGGGFTPGMGLVNRFRPYFDIFPVEVSSNLVDWSPLTWVVRTNASTDLLTVVDPEASNSPQRFYRTPATNLVSPARAPTGPYAVGRLDRLVTDPGRRNRYAISTNSSLVITLWYPAIAPVGQLPTPYQDAGIARSSIGWNGFQDRVPYLFGHSFRQPPYARTATLSPVVFYSHGLGDWRDSGEDKAENLASHGYVVVAVDHFDALETVFPDGFYVEGLYVKAPVSITDAGLEDRIADFLVIKERLEEWNRTDPDLAGTLDLERIAVFGFSWGGATAARLCQVAPWCKAAVLLDPGGWASGLPGTGLSKPSLTMKRADNTSLGVFDTSTSEAIWFQISGTIHYTFASWYFWDSSVPAATAQDAGRTLNAYLLWFLDRHLKGDARPMPALTDYPRVFNFKQK